MRRLPVRAPSSVACCSGLEMELELVKNKNKPKLPLKCMTGAASDETRRRPGPVALAVLAREQRIEDRFPCRRMIAQSDLPFAIDLQKVVSQRCVGSARSRTGSAVLLMVMTTLHLHWLPARYTPRHRAP